MKMKKTGISIDELFVKHENGFDHPESPDRVYVINDMLNQTEMIKKLKVLKPRDAIKEEITTVHTERYFEKIKSTDGKEKVFLDQDTSTNYFSYQAAVRASGGVLQCIDEILNNDIDNAFCIERPPGHHAEADRAMGFCLFNHVAVGAGYLQSKGFKRVLIIDWDVHHGNGTQHIFEDTDEVLFFSTHQFPYYPGTGSLSEIGTDKGQGFTFNVPLGIGMGDSEYIKIFQHILCKAANQYKPEFIIVSAGFDAFVNDPLGGMSITAEGFAKLTDIVLQLANDLCGGNILFVLEGGYELNGLWECTNKVFESILSGKRNGVDIITDATSADSTIEQVKEVYSKYWDFT